ncbi:MAG: sensor histidine kinase [Anaerolineae bacterium]|nr:sensor histidine kinase [Anaerolineae bacterium]
MALPDGQQGEATSWDNLGERVKSESQGVQRELKEIGLMLEQSQVEVEKLAQRNATITMHLQQVQGQIETVPRADIRVAYDAALDAQQRLVVMRSQTEKLQSEQNLLQRYQSLIKSVQESLVGSANTVPSANGGGSFASAEMMIQAQEAERQRLSRQMHDGPAQALTNFILLTDIAMRLFDVDQDKAREELTNLKVAAATTFQKVRDFIFDLRPMMLDDLGLIPTVKRYADAFREKSGMDVGISVSGSERRLESYLEVMIFRAIQELLKNASLHSQANQVKVQLDIGQNDLRVSIEDNGKGFDPAAAAEGPGLGIKLIKERVEMLGGYFEIDSAVGQGTRISFNVPAGDQESLA